MNENSNRKLAAIMFADIVSYTSLMQNNEQHALQTIQHYQSILSASVTTFSRDSVLSKIKVGAKSFNGQILKNYGDGSLMIFQMTEQFAEGKFQGAECTLKREGTEASSEGGQAKKSNPK